MYKFSFPIVFLVVVMFSTACSTNNKLVKNNFEFAASQTTKMLDDIKHHDKLPKSISDKDRSLVTVGIKDWTSGFFPGSMWYLYENTQDQFWKKNALKYTELLKPIQFLTQHHDVGFMMYCSYGNAYRLTGDKKYLEILENSAKSLSTRYSEKAGIIRSWNFKKSWSGKDWEAPVIVDNMMNLELLLFASEITKNPHYRNIAISHADKTLKNHLRDDYSSYHVVNYNLETGEVTDKATWQGYADNSAWARGQSWGVYGFTVMYRETKDIKYLEAAEKMANFYLNHPNMPKDGIPYWDFNVGQAGFTPPWKFDQHNKEKLFSRDASAAAIMASALIELSSYSTKKETYFTAAERMLKVLSSDYKNKANSGNHFILDHSVGNFPRNYEIDVPINYADYYYLEALLRYNKSKK